MHMTLRIEADVERQEGPFAGREELEEQLVSEIESANPGTLDGRNGGAYEITDWTVEAESPPDPRAARRRRRIEEAVAALVSAAERAVPPGEKLGPSMSALAKAVRAYRRATAPAKPRRVEADARPL